MQITLNYITVVSKYNVVHSVVLTLFHFILFLLFTRVAPIPSDRWILLSILSQLGKRIKIGDKEAADFKVQLLRIERELESAFSTGTPNAEDLFKALKRQPR